jgi:hypothetical protein
MRRLQIISRGRREFLRFLAASPLAALPGFAPGILADLRATERRSRGGDPQEDTFVLNSPEQALDVMEFEAAARKALPPAHFGYLSTGVDDDGTVRANHAAYARYEIRPRRLAGAGKIATSVRLLDATWRTPIVICPVGGQRAFHPEGEIAVARAARAKEHLQILSTATNTPVEEVITARGAPVWYQLYTSERKPRAARSLPLPLTCRPRATGKLCSSLVAWTRGSAAGVTNLDFAGRPSAGPCSTASTFPRLRAWMPEKSPGISSSG